MQDQFARCPECDRVIAAWPSGVLHPHHNQDGHWCTGCDAAAEAHDQWVLILREEMELPYGAIAENLGMTTTGARRCYLAARQRENARVAARGWA